MEKRRGLSIREKDLVIINYESGLQPRQIAEKLGLPHSIVASYMKQVMIKRKKAMIKCKKRRMEGK